MNGKLSHVAFPVLAFASCNHSEEKDGERFEALGGNQNLIMEDKHEVAYTFARTR